MNIHCEFSSRFHSDSKRIRSAFESKRRESPLIHKVFAQQYGFANFGRVFTVIRCETLSWDIVICTWRDLYSIPLLNRYAYSSVLKNVTRFG